MWRPSRVSLFTILSVADHSGSGEIITTRTTFIGLATWSTRSTIHHPTPSVTSEGDDLRVNVVYSNPEWLILLCLHFSLKLAYFREKFLTFHLTQMSQYSKAKCCYLRHIPPHKIEGLFHPRERETVQAVHDVFDMHECSYCSALSLGKHCFVWFTYLLILQQYCETVTSIANMWRFKGLLPEPFVPLVFWGPSMRVCMASACIRACGEDPPFNLKCWLASSEWNLTFTHTNRFRHK